MRMVVGDTLDGFTSKLGGMAARYAGLGSTLDDAAMVKKLLDSVPDRLYAAVAGIEQFCDVSTMPFEDALGRLNALDEGCNKSCNLCGEGNLWAPGLGWICLIWRSSFTSFFQLQTASTCSQAPAIAYLTAPSIEQI